MQHKLHAAKAHSVFKYPLSPSTPPRPRLQASEKLHSPIGLFKVRVRTSLCGREMASEPNILKRDGGALSSGNSTLMQRERGKKKQKPGKRTQRAGRSVKSVCRASGEGRWEKSGSTIGKKQKGSKVSNKQEKATGKAQEV